MKLLSHKFLIIHHSATPASWSLDKTLRVIDNTHRDRLHKQKNQLGYHIAYHYVIDAQGNVQNTRPLDTVGYHCGNWVVNQRSLGIMLCGNFMNEKPTEKQLEALSKLLAELKAQFGVLPENIKGHRNVKPTACPGTHLTDAMIADLASGAKPAPQKPSSWARSAWQKALKAGIVNEKSDPRAVVTKEEVVVMLERSK